MLGGWIFVYVWVCGVWVREWVCIGDCLLVSVCGYVSVYGCVCPRVCVCVYVSVGVCCVGMYVCWVGGCGLWVC